MRWFRNKRHPQNNMIVMSVVWNCFEHHEEFDRALCSCVGVSFYKLHHQLLINCCKESFWVTCSDSKWTYPCRARATWSGLAYLRLTIRKSNEVSWYDQWTSFQIVFKETTKNAPFVWRLTVIFSSASRCGIMCVNVYVYDASSAIYGVSGFASVTASSCDHRLSFACLTCSVFFESHVEANYKMKIGHTCWHQYIPQQE